jgi:hypothetical protein
MHVMVNGPPIPPVDVLLPSLAQPYKPGFPPFEIYSSKLVSITTEVVATNSSRNLRAGRCLTVVLCTQPPSSPGKWAKWCSLAILTYKRDTTTNGPQSTKPCCQEDRHGSHSRVQRPSQHLTQARRLYKLVARAHGLTGSVSRDRVQRCACVCVCDRRCRAGPLPSAVTLTPGWELAKISKFHNHFLNPWFILSS